MQLKDKYEAIVNEYIELFEKKQEMYFEFWIGYEIGGNASFGDSDIYSFNEIKLDIDMDLPKGEIIKWNNDNLEYPEKYINYKSYIMGLRVKDIISKTS